MLNIETFLRKVFSYFQSFNFIGELVCICGVCMWCVVIDHAHDHNQDIIRWREKVEHACLRIRWVTRHVLPELHEWETSCSCHFIIPL